MKNKLYLVILLGLIQGLLSCSRADSEPVDVTLETLDPQVREFSFNEYSGVFVTSQVGTSPSLYVDYDSLGPSVEGPSSPGVAPDGGLIFYEKASSHATWTDMDLNVLRRVKLGGDRNIWANISYPYVLRNGEILVVSASSNRAILFAEDGTQVQFFNPEYELHDSQYVNDVFLAWPSDGGLIGIRRRRDGIDTRPLVDLESIRLALEHTDVPQHSAVIDENGSLIVDGDILTGHYPRFIEHWARKYGAGYYNLPEHKAYVGEGIHERKFLGRDRVGNYFWRSGDVISVFDVNGISLENFKISGVPKSRQPTIEPNGSLLLLNAISDDYYRQHYEMQEPEKRGEVIPNTVFVLFRVPRGW